MRILITGGLGYIGSHLSINLLKYNHNITIIDQINAIHKINTTNILLNNENVKYIQCDLKNINKLNTIFNQNIFDIVIHLASYKSVPESLKNPLKYYNNNIIGTLNLLNTMNKHNCNNLIFSSSATVYGDQTYPVDENAQTGIGITNPYGKTKYMIEEILKDLYDSNDGWNITILRYFNPIGCMYGFKEDKAATNLYPHIIRCKENNEILKIYGNDYDTPDGTCIRDFIHINDLCEGHVVMLDQKGLNIYNLGTGEGTSVLQLVKKYDILYEFVDRRDGDIDIVYANVDKYKNLKDI